MQLEKLQTEFQAYVLNQPNAIVTEIVSNEFHATDRLAIYKEGYVLRLLESILADYPVLCQLLGTEKFNDWCIQYIENHPSNYRSIRWFGDSFSKFIQTIQPQNSSWHELAAFEWALSTAFDAPDLPCLTEVALQNIPPESWAEIRFQFHPSLQIKKFDWPVITAWKALQYEQKRIKIKKHQEPSTWMIWRQNLEPCFIRLKDYERLALEAAQQGVSFGEICENLSSVFPEDQVILQCAKLLKSWVNHNLITAITIE